MQICYNYTYMKHFINIFILLFSIQCVIYSYDFKSANVDGQFIYYIVNQDGKSVSVTYDKDTRLHFSDSTYLSFFCDTMRIPSYVEYSGNKYKVTCLSQNAFTNSNKKIKVLMLPETIDSICLYLQSGDSYYAYKSAFYWNNFEQIIIDSHNSHYATFDGILYTKDTTTLLVYPAAKKTDSVYVRQGVTTIGIGAFSNALNIRYLEFSLSVKYIQEEALTGADSLSHLVIQDSVETILDLALDCLSLTHLSLGNGLKYVGGYFVISDSLLNISCRAQTPPKIINSASHFLWKVIDNGSSLYVPRKSLNLYKQAEGWSQFKNIYPIEPPVVSGVNEAEVSWVQNFSATGYVWTLYLDEAQTQPYLQLTFDKDGHLTNIDLNRPNAPQLPAEEGDKQEDKRYAEYYSFTITGLDANTKYYYVRQSLAGERVIDEETGSFETLPDGAPTGVNPLLFEPRPQKTFENGMLRIRKNGNTYNVNGTKVE